VLVTVQIIECLIDFRIQLIVQCIFLNYKSMSFIILLNHFDYYLNYYYCSFDFFLWFDIYGKKMNVSLWVENPLFRLFLGCVWMVKGLMK
jgi:hypothetical protein